MLHHNLANVNRFTQSYTVRFPKRRAVYDNKDSHLTWNALLVLGLQINRVNTTSNTFFSIFLCLCCRLAK